jgi:hypothetical protein
VLHSVNDAGNACIAGAIDIGKEFLTGINDNGTVSDAFTGL